MRALFLLLAALLLAGCSGNLRTHPVGGSPPDIPKLTAPSESPITTIEKELAVAGFTQSSPNSPTWQKGTRNGGIIATLSQENGVTAAVQYNRNDGSAICKTEGQLLLVYRIQRWDLIPSAAQLIAEYGCTPA